MCNQESHGSPIFSKELAHSIYGALVLGSHPNPGICRFSSHLNNVLFARNLCNPPALSNHQIIYNIYYNVNMYVNGCYSVLFGE